MSHSSRQRLDLLLLQKGLASTRTKAQELIREGKVLVAGKVLRSPGEKLAADADIRVEGAEHPYVSRGGLKLEAALEEFSLNVAGHRVLDIGQSTGGFTDCLLKRGASAVVGIEVGQGQLDPSLRADARVSTVEKQDIRKLAPERIAPSFDRFVIDVSFISLRLVLPALPPFLSEVAEGVMLFKPQFEVGPDKIGSGGIVRDAAAREAALAEFESLCPSWGFTVAGKIPSPVKGGDGNLEVLLHLKRLSQGPKI